SSRRRHTRLVSDWSSDVCSSDLWKHSISTTKPEAQRYFDQGLALLYGFNRYEAIRSFRKAAEIDPNAAMAWWGIAMAQGPYVNKIGRASCRERVEVSVGARS